MRRYPKFLMDPFVVPLAMGPALCRRVVIIKLTLTRCGQPTLEGNIMLAKTIVISVMQKIMH